MITDTLRDWALSWSAAATVFAGAILAHVFLRQSRRSRYPLPPGPRRIPFLGNAHQMPMAEPWRVYKEWSHKYGDTIYLEAMRQPIVVLNSFKVMQEILVKRAANYSDRIISHPDAIMRTDWSFVLMRYGDSWREHRRVFHQFLNQGQISLYQPIIEEEVYNFVKGIPTGPADLRDHIRRMAGATIMRISYGVRGEYSERLIEKVDTFMRGWGEYAAPGRLLVSFFPSMKWIPSWVPGAGWKRRLEALAQLGLEVITQPFEDVKAKVAAGEQGEYHNIARSLVESLPDESDPTHAELKQIARNVSGISYVAGSDTTISSIYALLLALAMKPEVQREAQAEIDAVTGGDRLPTCSDKVELPYVQAIVKEGGRWHTVLPLCLPHMSVDDDVYDGYFIPAGTWIIPNSWAVMHDPEIFEDPMEFKPERYLKDGVIDPSVLDAESGSFGYGRRICPGRYLGMETITLTIASLLAVFDVRPVKDEAGRPIPLEYITESGVLVSPLPFKCELVPRSPRHAELLRS